MLRDPGVGVAVPRAIVGFHQDEESQWVADLECGHTQHVRHDPPWHSRSWVTTAGGRTTRIGTPLECVTCVTESADAASRVMDALRRIVRALRASSSASEQRLGVSSAQLFVLRQIVANPGTTVGELATRTLTSQSSVSEVAARLVARGLVDRRASRGDRRRTELFAKAQAKVVLHDAPDTAQERLIGGLARLPSEDRAALVRTMEAWLAASDLHSEPPTMFFEPVDER